MRTWVGLILFVTGCASSDPQPVAQYPQTQSAAAQSAQSAAAQSYEQTMARVKADREAQAQASVQLAADRKKEADDRLAQFMADNARVYKEREEQIQRNKENDPRYLARQQQLAQEAAEQAQCKATPGCEEGKSACLHFLQKKNAERNIYLEERNPAGVISLSDLHDWGNMARAEDEMFQADKNSYEKVSGKKFNEKVCGELAHN